MENASKALLMAGGVLISLIIISMLLLMFNSLNDYQLSEVQNEREKQILAFNEQYEGYNRKNIRGNELYSLINKVIDYNKRESSAADANEGTDNFQPMEITIDLTDNNNVVADLSRVEENEIFTEKTYVFNNASNTLSNIETMKEISNLRSKTITVQDSPYSYTEEILNNLVIGYDKIFCSNDDYNNKTQTDKVQIFFNFNSAFGKNVFKIEFKADGSLSEKTEKMLNTYWELLNEDSEIRSDINKYYEYVQFKRARFDCISVEYNKNTGRIVKMDFKFTGNFN